ncbi:MAG: inositol monophosphatase [Lachnospiraceae bacterium]|nr:inositol monophosphatase [Lachnospiraceae bacterium]MCM1230485.1 inositol monophosphatase [Ruminococcus flavefaciens]
MNMDSTTTISLLRKIVLDAGAMLTNGADKQIDIQAKTSSKDLVTQYDTLIENYITHEIRKNIANAQFICEESASESNLDSVNLFIIDPIDGTTNFIHSMQYSAVSVAWYRKGKPYYGIVFNPYANDIYEAQIGKGAFLNNKKIYVGNSSLQDSIVAFGTSPYNQETTDYTFDMIKEIYGRCQDIRRMGAASLDICQVAAGRIGLFFEAALSLWDYAAAQLILLEAGGSIVNFQGDIIKISTQKSSVIAGNKSIIFESKLIREE